MTSTQLVSVVVALRDEGPDVEVRLRALQAALASCTDEREILVVDNASTDDTVGRVRDALRRLPDTRLLCLSRRAEAEAAIFCGVERALGDLVVSMSLHEAEIAFLPTVIAAARDGSELVLVEVPSPAPHGALARLGRAGERMLSRLAGPGVDLDPPAYRCTSRRVTTFLLRHDDPGTLLAALPRVAAFPTVRLVCPGAEARERRGLLARVDVGTRAFLRATVLPLRLVTLVSLLAALLNVVYAVYVVGVRFFVPEVHPGWTTLSLQISGMFLLVSIALALLSEYVVRIFQATLQPPGYHVGHEVRSATMSREERINVAGPPRSE